MEFTSPHKYNKNASKQFSQDTYWTLVGYLRHLRGQEESLCDQVRHGKEGGGEKWKQDGTGNPQGWLGQKRFSHTQKGPLMAGGISRDEEEPSGDQREHGWGLPCPLGLW